MHHVSLQEYLARCSGEILDRCTSCGNCTINCEIRRYTHLRDEHPITLVEAMKECISTGCYDRVAYDFAFSCIDCLECTTYCGEGIEASALPLLTKARLVQEGHDAPAMFKMAQPCQSFCMQNILSAIQTRPGEKWWLDEVPDDPESHDVVLFMGCNEMPFPAAMTAARDILAELQLDFVSVGGGKNLCCGAVHMHTGEPEVGDRMGKRLVESLERFNPRTVLFTCPTCAYVMQKTLKGGTGSLARYVHFSRFLAERIDRLSFAKSVPGRLTLQDPCFTARGLGDYESPREVLSVIPQAELVEMEHNRQNALCCGVTALANNSPGVADTFIQARLREALEAGADTVVNVCAGCQMAFFTYEKALGLQVRMFSEVVAEAMGLGLQPDTMKHFRDLADPAHVIEATPDAIAASPYSPDEIAAVLPFVFR